MKKLTILKVMEATVQEQQITQNPTSPRLTCVVTGKTRPSNEKYLSVKADQRNVSVEYFTEHYTCKQAVKRLRAGMAVKEVRAELEAEVSTPISDEMVKEILRVNGKTKA